MCVMKINSVGNAGYSPACKELYFIKTPTIAIDKGMEYMVQENVSKSRNGVRYLKDNEISGEIKEKLASLPFIQKISNKYETFVWYAESKLQNVYRSWVKISHIKELVTLYKHKNVKAKYLSNIFLKLK